MATSNCQKVVLPPSTRSHCVSNSQGVTSSAMIIARGLFAGHEPKLERLKGGLMNHMFRVNLDHGDAFVLRLYPLSRKKVARYEADFIQRLRGAGGTVAEILHSYDAPDCENYSWLAYRYIEGTSLEQKALSAPALSWLACRIVENLQLIAGLQVDGSGGLVTALNADSPSPQAFFVQSFERCLRATEQNGTLQHDVRDALESLLDTQRRSPWPTDGRVSWGDLAPSNIIVDEQGELRGMVDFESLFAFDSSLSLGYRYAIDPTDPLLIAVLAAASNMGFTISPDTMRLCAVLRAARMLVHAHLRLPSGHPQRDVWRMMPGAMQALRELTR